MADQKPLNFIFFQPDEMRAESLACYGHPVIKTPNYDRLAAEGVRFDQCHVQNAQCTPSRVSMMTGPLSPLCRASLHVASDKAPRTPSF